MTHPAHRAPFSIDPATGEILEGAPSPSESRPAPPSYPVGRIVAYLRELLETDTIVADLWISGEISSLSRSQAGHLYFSLGDADGALRCIFFRRENAGAVVEEGAQIIAHGRISIYEERGDLQFYVDTLQAAGVGLLHAAFLRLRTQLEAEGLFDPARKRPMPRYPRTVGVVSSPAGAVWHDIQTVMGRRWPTTALLLAPCRVQGEGAAATIVQAIEALNARAEDEELDAIIVARGGGSLEDLWPFNAEEVARALFASAVPTVSAIGHETDYTIADYVADLRAPTPSAAAELLVPNQAEERTRLHALQETLARALDRSTESRREALDRLAARLEHTQPDFAPRRLHIDDLIRRATHSVDGIHSAHSASLAELQGRLLTLNPHATLARGYVIVQDERGRAVPRVAALRPGAQVRMRFQDGVADAAVQRVESKEWPSEPPSKPSSARQPTKS